MRGQPDLEGLSALVTGATSGIGKAAAEELARHGAEVVVHGRDASRGEAAVDAIAGKGGKARFIAADLSQPAELDDLVTPASPGSAPTADLDIATFDALFAATARQPADSISVYREVAKTNPQYHIGRGNSMADVVKKYSISSELAQNMVDEAVAKARDLGVTENVTILDDGGNLKAFSRMDGAPILCIEMAHTALFGVSTQDFFNFIQGDPSLLAGIPTLARVAAWGGGFPIKVNGEVVGAIGLSGAPTVQDDTDCAKAALALVPDAVPTEYATE